MLLKYTFWPTARRISRDHGIPLPIATQLLGALQYGFPDDYLQRLILLTEAIALLQQGWNWINIVVSLNRLSLQPVVVWQRPPAPPEARGEGRGT